MKKLLAFLCVAATAGVFAAPTISGLKVTPVEPLGLVIDYAVSGAEEADAARPIEVSLTAGDATYIAKNLTGAINCVNGAHRVYWHMVDDGLPLALDVSNAAVKVAYKYVALDCALYCVIDLSGGANATSYLVTYMNVEPRGGFNATLYKTTKLVLKRVDAGSFTMGNSSESDNQPHSVTLTKPFYMGLFEVTQKQWHQVMGSNPCSSTLYGKGDTYPIHFVSYHMIRGSSNGAKWPSSNAVDASSFLGKLRAKTGDLLFDLPTEAQWEYACRAGTTTTYSYGDSENGAYMWYSSNSFSKTHEVGTKLPNKWGFYDMHGNVWEWCLDGHGTLAYGTDPKGSSSDLIRVLRGGSWHSFASSCTSSNRNGYNPSTDYYNYGFRLSRTLP